MHGLTPRAKIDTAFATFEARQRQIEAINPGDIYNRVNTIVVVLNNLDQPTLRGIAELPYLMARSKWLQGFTVGIAQGDVRPFPPKHRAMPSKQPRWVTCVAGSSTRRWGLSMDEEIMLACYHEYVSWAQKEYADSPYEGEAINCTLVMRRLLDMIVSIVSPGLDVSNDELITTCWAAEDKEYFDRDHLFKSLLRHQDVGAMHIRYLKGIRRKR